MVVAFPVPVPGVLPLLGGMAGGVVVPSGLVVVPGVTPGVVVAGGAVVSGVALPPVPEVPEVPELPLVPGVVAGAASGVAAGAVVVSLRLLQPPSSAHTMAVPRTSLLVLRSEAVMMVPFSLESCRETAYIARLSAACSRRLRATGSMQPAACNRQC